MGKRERERAERVEKEREQKFCSVPSVRRFGAAVSRPILLQTLGVELCSIIHFSFLLRASSRLPRSQLGSCPLLFSLALRERVRESVRLLSSRPALEGARLRQGQERKEEEEKFFRETTTSTSGGRRRERKKKKGTMDAPPLPPPLSERLVRACSSIKEHSVRRRNSSLIFHESPAFSRGFFSLRQSIDFDGRKKEREARQEGPQLFIPLKPLRLPLFFFAFFFVPTPRQRARCALCRKRAR